MPQDDAREQLQKGIETVLGAIDSLKENASFTLPSYYDFIANNANVLKEMLIANDSDIEAMREKALEFAAASIRTLTDYIGDDKHPVISSLLRLQVIAKDPV